MTPLRSGDLRHRIAITRTVQTKQSNGSYWEVTGEVARPWAEVRSEGGKEAVMDQVLQGIAVYRIRIRWRGDVKASDQIDYSGSAKPLNIRSADDPDGRREQLVIVADTASTRAG